jgi:hypothetical protein
MINQEEHLTSKDKHTAFELKMEWLEEWIIEACVDKDDLWKQLEKMKMNKGSKNQSLAAMFSECLKEVEETFNSKTVFKVFLPHETSTVAVDSHTKILNTYLALIEFAKTIKILSGQVDYKVKKFIKPFLTEDFGKFNTTTFMKKLKYWGKYTNDRKNGPKEQLNVDATNARREAHTEKLKKAIAEGKCLHCQMEDCLTQRKAESKKSKMNLGKIECKVNPRKSKQAKFNKHDASDSEDEDTTHADANSYSFKPLRISNHFNELIDMSNGMNEIWFPSSDEDFDDEPEKYDPVEQAQF